MRFNRDPQNLFMGFLDIDLYLKLGFALFLVIALISVPLAILITLVLNRLFRHRVAQSMRATASTPAEPEMRQPPPAGPLGELALDRIDATGTRTETAHAMPLLGKMRRCARELAAIYAEAAFVYPLVLAVVIILETGSAPKQHVILWFALFFGLCFAVNATPVALAPTMVLKKQVRFLSLAVLGLIIVLWAWGAKIGTNAVGIWLMIASIPTGMILLLNLRRLRAVGPVVSAATLLLLFGLIASPIYAAFYALDEAGPMRFVRQDLAHLPLLDATKIWLGEILRLPLDQMQDYIRDVVNSPSSVLRPEHPERLTTAVWLYFFGIWLAGTAAGVAAAWAFVRWLARSYQARRASDQMLTLDVMMMIFTLPTFLIFIFAFSWIGAAAVPVSFASYMVFSRWRLRHRECSAHLGTPRWLLLLRVFGFDRRTQRLLDDLGQCWRYLGPIRLIGGPDLAYATLEPYEFFEFLSGRLARAFIKDRDDLDVRLTEGTAIPDPDGLFRIEDFFCHDDTWRMTISRLARKADAILMDLRGFMSKNRGCIFEIEQLIASVPLQRILLLVDRSTDVLFLEEILQRAWRIIPTDSPNAIAGEHRLRILQASPSHRHTLNALLGLLGV
jgi:hypothetical protein